MYLKKLEVIAPNKDFNAREIMNRDYDKFIGAYVKDPIQGSHDWVYDLDLTSMYPSTIMTLNISPETKIGKINGWDAVEFIKGISKTYSLEKNGKEIIEFCNHYKSFEQRVPLIVVPSTYAHMTEYELQGLGVNVVIYANHLLRSAYPAMVNTAKSLLENNRGMEASNDYCMSIKEIITLIPDID